MLTYKKEQIQSLSSKVLDIKELVETICLSDFNKIHKKQILVDISGIIKYDPKTGISRVVKSQFIKLFYLKQNDYDIRAVYLKKINNNYHYFYANNYMQNILKLNIKEKKDFPIIINKNDILYIADLSPIDIENAITSKLFKKYKYLGLKIFFLVYDLLPVKYPYFFRDNQDKIHHKWLDDISSISPEFITISKSVKKDLKLWLKKNKPENEANITSIHLGADFPNTQSNILKNKIYTKSENINFLIVSTIEPRKAHAQLLEAFENLWNKEQNINLHLVGKKGWVVDELLEKIKKHKLLNKKLFYYDFVDDKTLKELYTNSDVIIVPSYDEGFGLPIIEARYYKKPIIARDIEVFKEVAKDCAFYFKDTKDSNDLSISISKWIELYKKNIHPKSNNLSYLSWEENAKITFDYLTNKQYGVDK